MGTQTNIVITKDVGVETDREVTQIPTISSEEIVSEVRKSRGDENSIHLVSPKPKLSKTLTNHEEQSISELFKVRIIRAVLTKILCIKWYVMV